MNPTITLTLIYDPTKLRVRAVQEGSFMRAGGVNVTFSQQVSGNRVDIALVRSADLPESPRLSFLLGWLALLQGDQGDARWSDSHTDSNPSRSAAEHVVRQRSQSRPSSDSTRRPSFSSSPTRM